ncbi:MAG: hypothetical protein IE936_09310 [Moraxella osloensis]|nr:hypothetical protein [Moraxella osloensis]
MIVQHAANGIDTTGSTAVTLSHVKVIDANVTAITATGGAVVEDSSIWGTLDEAASNSVGVKITGDATVRRNLITNTKTAISMSGLTTQAIDINHNILANNGVGIYSYYNTTSNYPRAQIFYNTIDGSATYGINMNNNGNSVKYNIITNSGTSAIYATNNYDTSVNAFYGNTADYSGGIADMASAYANLSEDPSYTSVSQSITAENMGHGIYGDLLNVDNYKTTNPTYATYTPYSSRMGAYNLIAYVDTNITQDRSDVQRAYSESFVKDGMSLSGTIKTAMKNMDITIDSTNLDSTASSIYVVKNGYEQSYTLTIGSDNSVADGNHTINIAVVDIVDATVANNVDYGVFNLDNSGPTLSLVDYVNDTNVTQNQTIHFAISDALVGAREYQFSTDGGVNWTEGDAHLVLTSAGENDGNTADISFDSVNVVNGEFGFNVVEINSSDFSLVSTSAQTFGATNVDAFTSYLNALADGTTIAFVVKQNGRDTDATRHNNLVSALAKFGFSGTFSTYDSVAFIGQKGLKKIHAITKIVPSGSGIAQINLTTEYGIANSAFTIDSCYNQDVDFTCHIKARGIDYLGNVGSVFDVNYKIAQ